MKVIDIKHGKSQYEKKIGQFKKSLLFKDFTVLLEMCLKNREFNCEEIYNEWTTLKLKIIPNKNIADILELYCITKIAYEPKTPPAGKNDDSETDQLINTLVDVYELGESKKSKYKDTYSWFSPAISIVDVLESLYSDELNPGRVIGRNLNILFPNEMPARYKEYISAEPLKTIYSIPYNSILAKMLIESVDWAINNSIKDDFLKKCILDCYYDLQGEERVRSTTIGECIIALQYTSESFYRLWVDVWLLNENYHYGTSHKPTSDDLMIALLGIPFGKGNYPLAFNPEFNRYIENKKLIKYLDEKRYSPLIFFPFSTIVEILDLFEMFTPNAGDPIVIKKLVSNSTKFRVEYLGGIFPLKPFDVDNAWHISNILDEDDNDLLFLLSRDHIGVLDDFRLSPEKSDIPYFELATYYNTKQTVYLRLVYKSYEEGLYELGTALLSLFLFYRAAFLSGGINFNNQLLTAIDKALSLPGDKILKCTLSTILECIESYFAKDPVALRIPHQVGH